MQRVVSFMEFRHYLSLARQYEDKDLAERITATMHFHCRLTNMVRRQDPTSQHLLNHYAKYYKGSDDLPDLILNIVWLRNTMSREIVKMCELGKMPWLRVEHGCLTEASKKSADETFLGLGGRVFYGNVEPMSSRSRCPRRGWADLVSELVDFAKKAKDLAALWPGENGVADLAAEIRKIPAPDNMLNSENTHSE